MQSHWNILDYNLQINLIPIIPVIHVISYNYHHTPILITIGLTIPINNFNCRYLALVEIYFNFSFIFMLAGFFISSFRYLCILQKVQLL